jgi:hypothetical protein
VVDVAFAACGKSLTPQFVVRQFERLVFLLKLFDDVVFGGQLNLTVGQRHRLLPE